MKKSLIIILSLIIIQIPAFSANKKMVPSSGNNDIQLKNIFIYEIPDNTKEKPLIKDETDALESDYIENNSAQNNDEDITLETEYNCDEKGDITLGAAVLKGYAEYMEDSQSIHLKDDYDDFVLNIKVPQKITSSKGMNLKRNDDSKPVFQYKDAEYAIAPSSIKTSSRNGNFTFGALYGNEVDNIAMLEEETGLFTKYEKNRFALSTSYKKNLNTTYALFYDTVSIAPEVRLNNYMSLKNEYKADITRNRRSGSLILSLNPFGKKDYDRMRFELGAKQTVYMDTDFTKTEFSFSTQFKL